MPTFRLDYGTREKADIKLILLLLQFTAKPAKIEFRSDAKNIEEKDF
jgi:hypothetical protein